MIKTCRAEKSKTRCYCLELIERERERESEWTGRPDAKIELTR